MFRRRRPGCSYCAKLAASAASRLLERCKAHSVSGFPRINAIAIVTATIAHHNIGKLRRSAFAFVLHTHVFVCGFPHLQLPACMREHVHSTI